MSHPFVAKRQSTVEHARVHKLYGGSVKSSTGTAASNKTSLKKGGAVPKKAVGGQVMSGAAAKPRADRPSRARGGKVIKKQGGGYVSGPVPGIAGSGAPAVVAMPQRGLAEMLADRPTDTADMPIRAMLRPGAVGGGRYEATGMWAPPRSVAQPVFGDPFNRSATASNGGMDGPPGPMGQLGDAVGLIGAIEGGFSTSDSPSSAEGTGEAVGASDGDASAAANASVGGLGGDEGGGGGRGGDSDGYNRGGRFRRKGKR